MKKTLLIITIFMAGFSFAQDTTAYRMLGLSSNSELYFFDDDTTESNVLPLTGATGHALYVNPADSLIYAIIDELGDSQRSLYKVDPFNGTKTHIYDFNDTHIASGDLGENNVLYAISGNGGTAASQVIALNLTTLTETVILTSAITNSRALEYNPIDSSLYIYEGYSDLVYIVNLATGLETSSTTANMNDELHGVYFDPTNNSQFITAYGGEIYTTTGTNWLSGNYWGDATVNVMDLTIYPTIRSFQSTSFCPGDSALLSTIYARPSVKWFLDGVEITSTTNDSIYVNTAGTYRALMEISGSGNYVWSEPIAVTLSAVPVVTISSAGNDQLICPGETIVLTGASGGTLQWFLDGAPIIGANASTYSATTPGAYNQSKTNTSGCLDTADVNFVITLDAPCDASINENALNLIQLFPNPATDFITMTNLENNDNITIIDAAGRVISTKIASTSEMTFEVSSLLKGVYFVKIQRNLETITLELIK